MNRHLLLGFRAFDAHELLCHFAAREAGYYQSRGLRISLRDLTFDGRAQSSLPCLSTACAAGLMEILQGVERRLLLVAMRRPLFWLYGGPNTEKLEQLDGGRIAGYVDFSPPARFLTWRLADVAFDQYPAIDPVRDDLTRLGLLLSGEVDAGLFSSAVSPAYLQELGLNNLISPVDLPEFSTTGLTTERWVIERFPELVDDMVAAHAEAIVLLQDDEFLTSVLQQLNILGGSAGLTSNLRRALTDDGRIAETFDQSPLLRHLARDMCRETMKPDFSTIFDFTALSRFLESNHDCP
ncbi:MAG: hypothetical protein ABW155_15720 [Candidatus Thiodiazotropha sp.]